MNGAGRVIHAAVWARGGQRGPGGSAIRSTIRRTAKKLSAARPRRRYDALGPAETRGWRIGGLNRLRLPRLGALPRGRASRVGLKQEDGPITQLAPRVTSSQLHGALPARGGGPLRGLTPRELWLLVALLGWCVAIALVDAFAVQGAVLIGLLITGPLVSALFGSARVTAVIGLFAVVAGIVLGLADDMFLTADHIVRVGILALGSGLAIVLARTRERLEGPRPRYSLLSGGGGGGRA